MANPIVFSCALLVGALTLSAKADPLRAGSAAVDITPKEFPVIVNGGFLEKQATKVVSPLHARAIVLDDGSMRLAICVVDTCMMTRELIDSAKEIAHHKTGIPVDRMLVSATHTHSAPSAMACLGTSLDRRYAAFLPGKIAEAIGEANRTLAPARVGWGTVAAWDYTNCRRWIRRPDKMITDPFGVVSARANMHPGPLNPDAIAPSGPIDPEVSFLSVQGADGKPMALLANFSMHYFGASPLSPDYFGMFANGIGKAIGAHEGDSFVGIMSQGTSGDSQWRDYAARASSITAEQYADGLVNLVAGAYRNVEHRASASLAMAEAKLRLRRRVADEKRLEWAREVVAKMGDRIPANQPEVYAREQVLIAAEPERELKLQALRIGEFGISAIPDEVYAITGLKLKARSPLQPTMNIELANGSEGYIPPPEQHALGGYTTWAARTAGLERQAEPRIVETVIGLLEKVSGKKARRMVDEHGAYAQAVLAAKPLAYWRMNEIVPPTATDASGNGHDARYDWEHGVAFYLLGAGNGMGASSRASLTTTAFSGPNQLNRAPHFAGGAMKAELKELGPDYTTSFWLWNGLDPKAREITGIALTRGTERVGITGTAAEPSRLFFAAGNGAPIIGKTPLLWKDWHHVAVVRDGKRVTLFLDGKAEISGDAAAPSAGATLHFGGNPSDGNTLEGKVDEAAVFNRVLSAGEVLAQYQTSGPPPRAIIAAPAAAKAAAPASTTTPQFGADHKAAVNAMKPVATMSLQAPGKTFAGERIPLTGNQLPDGPFSVSFWFRNDLPNTTRAVTAYLFSRGPNGNPQAPGDHLGIGGTYGSGQAGRLMFYNGNERHQTLVGGSMIAPGSWNHVLFVRDGKQASAYLNGKLEFSGIAEFTAMDSREVFLGARCDNFAPLRGALAEFHLFNRALTLKDAAQLGKGVEFNAAPQVAKTTSEPLPPAESLRKIHVPAGFKVELIAAEPLLIDPVAFDWDERGRLWVVEMSDYPLGMDNQGQPGGRVRVLEDADGDGRYEKSTLFAEGLNFPNGLITWRDGVIVTAAPDILFLRDTNGDGCADEQQVLVSGLQEGNQQLRANGLRWGLDNWVYVAAGGHHGKYGVDTRLRSIRTGEEVLVGSRDFRFRPDSGELEPQSGPTQFGRNRDNWGHWFGSQNSNPLWHYVLPDQYLRRNPFVAVPETRVQLLTPANPPVFPASPLEKRYHSFDQSGHYTSGCSGMVLRDRQLFPLNEINGFACEPFHNLVQHARLTDSGVSFTANRATGEGPYDFFASEDRWCRPVMVREGPDGALWVADMYRYMIEHPQFLPPVGKDELLPHFRAGDDRGRIYRVSRDGAPAFHALRFDRMSTAELVAALDSTNGWQRDKAQQVLLWRADSSAVAPLQNLAKKCANPLARLHALCTLDGLGKLTPALVATALSDKEAGVRENALRLAESRPSPDVLAAAVRLVGDPDAKVRLQLAFSLGAWGEKSAGETLATLLKANATDSMMVAAVMSSATPHVRALAQAPGVPMEPLLNTALGLNDREAVAELLAPVFTAKSTHYSQDQLNSFARLLDLLGQHNRSLATLESTTDDALARLLARSGALFRQARETAQDPAAPANERIPAAALLSRSVETRLEAINSLAAWLEPQNPADRQAAAIRALGETGAAEIPGTLARAWPTLSPSSRQAALATWISREAWALDFVQRIARKELTAASVDAIQRGRLLKHDSPRVRQIAAKLFSGGVSAARSKVVDTYRSVLALSGDAAKGRDVYLRNCAVCHKHGSDGKDIGPDLASVVEHPPEKLLGSILDPNADIQPGFNGYTCTLKTGEQIYGLVAAETANSVSMKLPDASQRIILRSQITTLQSQNLSLMPEGLEAAITKEDMANLIAFLRTPLQAGAKPQ